MCGKKKVTVMSDSEPYVTEKGTPIKKQTFDRTWINDIIFFCAEFFFLIHEIVNYYIYFHLVYMISRQET